jgi:hypothetical protein
MSFFSCIDQSSEYDQRVLFTARCLSPWRISMKLHLRSLLLGIALIGLFVGPVSAQNVVVPNADAAVEGNLNNGFPFNITAFGLPSQRYQQVFRAGDFGAIVGPHLITAITFRPDASGSAFSSTLPNVQINLSTTSAAVDALSTTFAANVGGNDTVVYSGALPLSSSAIGGPPRNFDITITLTTPFLYNPGAGNLLLDVRNFSAGSTTQFDAENTVGDAVSRIYTTSSGVGSATADGSDTVGLVTQFTFTVGVPEPSTFLLLGSTIVTSAVYLRFRRKNKSA